MFIRVIYQKSRNNEKKKKKNGGANKGKTKNNYTVFSRAKVLTRTSRSFKVSNWDILEF